MNQSGIREGAVVAITLRAKAIKSGELAAGSDLENRALSVVSAKDHRPVENPVARQSQPGVRTQAVRPETVQCGQSSSGSDFENCAEALDTVAVSRAVKVPVEALDER